SSVSPSPARRSVRPARRRRCSPPREAATVRNPRARLRAPATRPSFAAPPCPLLECDLCQASQLARVQPFALLCPQRFQGSKPDFEVLLHPLTIKLARHAGQLDLAVQRLVGDAEERAVRHPATI